MVWNKYWMSDDVFDVLLFKKVYRFETFCMAYACGNLMSATLLSSRSFLVGFIASLRPSKAIHQERFAMTRAGQFS